VRQWSFWIYTLREESLDHPRQLAQLLADVEEHSDTFRAFAQRLGLTMQIAIHAVVPEDASMPIWEFSNHLLTRVVALGADLHIALEFE
jgi:hypothetical protein